MLERLELVKTKKVVNIQNVNFFTLKKSKFDFDLIVK